jgi:hypothetical protein
MVWVNMDLKKYFEHKSIYGFSPVELRLKLKKEIEQIWIYFANSIIPGVIGGYMFYQGYQHVGIILYILMSIMFIATLFQYQQVTMIDQAIFLLENTETKEDRYA